MSKLGFGMMRLPHTDPGDKRTIDIGTTSGMVDMFLGAGMDYFDTGYFYHGGESENAVRRCLVDRYPRGSFRLADKMPIMKISTREEQESVFRDQLAKCGVDFFDSYLIHNVCTSFLPVAEELDTFGFVESLKREGKAGRIGFSFHDRASMLDDLLDEHPGTDFVQLQLNYMDWESPSVESRKCYEVARDHGVPVVVMEPVKGGILADVPAEVSELFESVRPGMSPASWAIRFAASLDGVETVLSGMSAPEQMRDNVSFMRDMEPMSDEELDTVGEAVGIIRRSLAVQCTSCRYCEEACPEGIPVADYFSLYNAEVFHPHREFFLHRHYYRNISKKHTPASGCIGCGRCEEQCPQHLPVRELLKNVADLFETED